MFVRLPLADGRFLEVFTDTGGGGSMLTKAAADREGVVTSRPEASLSAELGPSALLALAPAVDAKSGLPPIAPPLMVVPGIFPFADWPEQVDGMLGQSWFSGRSWTWDYPARRLSMDCAARGTRVPMGLPRADAPQPAKQFPRLMVSIAGEPVAVLLDTGATTWLTKEAHEAIGDAEPAVRATSMITASRVARWRTSHPEWRVVENAQRLSGARMIEVPDVRIAGIQVGPVWFTERNDRNFIEMMSSMMAGPVEGAIGGNALRSLRMTIDYRKGAAWFEQSAGMDCGRVPKRATPGCRR